MNISFLRISGTVKELRIVWQHFAAQLRRVAPRSVAPAASIFSFAWALKACALTVSFFEISPRARIFTGWRRLARPASRSDSGSPRRSP